MINSQPYPDRWYTLLQEILVLLPQFDPKTTSFNEGFLKMQSIINKRVHVDMATGIFTSYLTKI